MDGTETNDTPRFLLDLLRDRNSVSGIPQDGYREQNYFLKFSRKRPFHR